MSENDTPKKTLSIIRKPSGAGATATPATRTGKRIIRREDLPQVQRLAAPNHPPTKPNPKNHRANLHPKNK